MGKNTPLSIFIICESKHQTLFGDFGFQKLFELGFLRFLEI
jgi:hypothetical protein